MDPDVVEVPPSMFQHTPMFKKHKQSILHDVIDIVDDNENDDDDLMILGEITRKHNKGKAPQALHEGYGDNHQVVRGMEKSGTISGIESSNRRPSVSHSVINVDYLDLSSDECMEVDEYTLLQAEFDNVNLPTGIEASFTSQPNNSITRGFKISSSSLQSGGTQLSSKAAASKKNSLGVESSKSRRFMKSVRSKGKHGLADNPDVMKPPYLGRFECAKVGAGCGSSFHSDFVGQNGSLRPCGVESGKLWSKSSCSFVATPKHVHGSTSALKSARNVHKAENVTLRKLRSFKQFDTVIDTSDHHFINDNSSSKQNLKSWAKIIQKEWKILEKHLPDTIFVRVYESRMDLMRAVIIGAEGTPYHNGLFFFDIHFPSGYPDVPPNVHYHSRGLEINPNLYDCGTVCLSLLNTWSGSKEEMWTKGVSTMLQVLVSIQGLILNAKPYFNEPECEDSMGTSDGEMDAQEYNQSTFILSLRTMMYTIRKPPKNFEDLVAGHFYSRAHDILASCKAAYMGGVEVGCLVKEFENIGVDCKKFRRHFRL